MLYRLRVIPIFVPPLRDRKEDIPLIANFILSEQQTIFQHTPSLSNDALNALIDYDWPGNVRELKNTLLYAITMANEKSEIELCDLPDEIIDNPHIPSDLKMHTTEHIHSSDKINKDMIRKALIKYDYDLNQVAKALDMSRTTLWRYRKKFNL